jgi:hypothetical protein
MSKSTVMTRKPGWTDKENAGYVLITPLVPILFALLFWAEFVKLASTRVEFILLAALLFALNLFLCVFTIIMRETLQKNVLFYSAAVAAVACSIWIGTWCAQLRWAIVV